MIFKFYCDESYDDEPNNYVVAGFFADNDTWSLIEKHWVRINDQYRVRQFHASYLNGKRGEFYGWSDDKKIAYSAELLKVLQTQKRRVHVISCGMLADEYRKIISAEGQNKLGHPYLACFKTCVVMMAKEMDLGHFPPRDQFAVVIDRSSFAGKASEAFYHMKDNPKFKYRHRLATLTVGNTKEIIPLQPSDMIAYEVFKRLRVRKKELEMRVVLKNIFGINGVSERVFGVASMNALKDKIENANCARDRLVIIPT